MKTRALMGLVMAVAAMPGALVSAHSVECASVSAPHVYGAGGSAGGKSVTVTGSGDSGAGVVTASENNTADCDGDGVPGDFDGDYEAAGGGGFFGAGAWANEAICQYGLRTHGTAVTVTDVISPNIAFLTGADDQQGPIVIPDPVNGGNICETDGSISPGDPTLDPTVDTDDCLSAVYINSGSACGTGGDGGYWVFLSPCVGSEPPTAGVITVASHSVKLLNPRASATQRGSSEGVGPATRTNGANLGRGCGAPAGHYPTLLGRCDQMATAKATLTTSVALGPGSWASAYLSCGRIPITEPCFLVGPTGAGASCDTGPGATTTVASLTLYCHVSYSPAPVDLFVDCALS